VPGVEVEDERDVEVEDERDVWGVTASSRRRFNVLGVMATATLDSFCLPKPELLKPEFS
jgi:hypothetical protein